MHGCLAFQVHDHECQYQCTHSRAMHMDHAVLFAYHALKNTARTISSSEKV
jgi:hypothetical protein